jgi:hypothetical protein
MPVDLAEAAIAEARLRGAFQPRQEDPLVFYDSKDGVVVGGAMFDRAALKKVGPQSVARVCDDRMHMGPTRVNIGTKEFPCVRTMNRNAGHAWIPADADEHAAAVAASKVDGPMRLLVQVRAGTAQAGVCSLCMLSPLRASPGQHERREQGRD